MLVLINWVWVFESYNESVLSSELDAGPFCTVYCIIHDFFLEDGGIWLFGNIFLVSFSVQTN